MSLAIVYTDCKIKASGDFSAAGEVAYALQNYYFTIGQDTQCILASSKDGVDVFKRLYGTKNGIEIHGQPFEVVCLNDFTNDARKKYVDQYVEVAYCKPAPLDVVAKIVDPLSTKVLMVSTPQYGDNNLRSELKSRFPRSYANGLGHSVNTGFGNDSVGVFVYDGPFEQLKDKDYCDITKKPYGFAYFKGGTENDPTALFDYLKLTTSLPQPYRNFVFVGDCALNEDAIKIFVYESKSRVEIINMDKGTVTDLMPDRYQGIRYQERPLTKDYENKNEHIIRICLLPKVPNNQMRSLLKFSEPLVCAEGVNTEIEAIAFGKIPFIQYMRNNRKFYEVYMESVVRKCPWEMKNDMKNLLLLCLRSERMQPLEIETLKKLLADQTLIDKFLQINEELVRDKSSGAKNIANELQKKDPIRQYYYKPAFNFDDKKIDLRHMALLNNLANYFEPISSPYISNSMWSQPASSSKQRVEFSVPVKSAFVMKPQ